MEEDYTKNDRREFLRYDYERPLHYSLISSPKDTPSLSSIINGVSKNLSASGILFITDARKVPEISSLIVLDLDYKTAHVCREIDERAVIVKNKLLGRVVRIEDNEDGTCGVGVAFINKSDNLSKDIKSMVK